MIANCLVILYVYKSRGSKIRIRAQTIWAVKNKIPELPFNLHLNFMFQLVLTVFTAFTEDGQKYYYLNI